MKSKFTFLPRFAKYAWFLVGYNVLVILWGAVVRATGSGAGCGNYWPKCNGQVIPQTENTATLIEFSHRVTSTLAGFLVIILVVWAFRAYQKGSKVRKAAVAALVLILVEGWLGMLLVRLDLVADTVSIQRAYMVALHLSNTYLLLASLAITAWLASGNENAVRRPGSREKILIGLCVLSAILFSAMGAVTALGDTLFPSESLISGLEADLDPTSNFLIQLRVVHPILAVATSLLIFYVGGYLKERGLGRSFEQALRVLYIITGIQLAAGLVTVVLLAPIYMQITHLLLADSFWLSLVVVTLEVWTQREPSVQPVRV